MKKRPNVLVLMSDEHRADVAGFAGDPVARTPVLDWLAEGGVTFDNAYTPSPICVPARQCIMAGQYPRTCGCEGWVGLRPGHMTYPARFGQYGYRTTAFGKLHMVGPDQSQGWQSRPVGDVSFGRNYPVIESYERSLPEDPRNVPGMLKWSDRKEIERAGTGHNNPNDRQAIEGALEYIESNFVGSRYDRADPNHPTLLYVGQSDPHYPYLCEPGLFAHYLPLMRAYAVEEPFDHPFLGLSPWPPEPLQAGVHIAECDVMRARAAYYGKVETMDANFGRVLESLREAGQDLDDWIIVYLSDHGDQLGEHGVWEKQKFFEGSARVPFIIRYPKSLPKGMRIPQNVSLCDLFATLCDLCGLEPPDDLDSRSLLPLIQGNCTDWPDEACSFFLQQGFTNVMIKQGHLKYQWYQHEEKGVMPEVLFDLERDPLEKSNLIDDPAYETQPAFFRDRLSQLAYGPPE
jgi:choline-sulfatase